MGKKLSYEKLLAESTCSVDVYRQARGGEVGELIGLAIEFGGVLAAIPSTSNSKQIIQRQGYRPLLVNSFGAQTKLKAMTALYRESMKNLIYPDERFVDQVHVQVFLSKRKGRFDSHNFSKTVGDWLEKIGLIDDDQDAEIHCYKKVDYVRFSKTLRTTRIEIQRMEAVQAIVDQASQAASKRLSA